MKILIFTKNDKITIDDIIFAKEMNGVLEVMDSKEKH